VKSNCANFLCFNSDKKRYSIFNKWVKLPEVETNVISKVESGIGKGFDIILNNIL
jgi:hypothetical protein